MSSALRGLTGFILLLLLTVSALLLTTAQSAAQDVDEDEATPPPIPITGDELRNLSYPNEWPADGVAPLRDGIYTEPIPDSVAQVRVEFRRAAFGELDGRAAAAVVLATDPGGSGTFYDLHLVTRDDDGAPRVVASYALGDRIRLQALAFGGETVRADFTGFGPDDAACCPTLNVTHLFQLRDGELELTTAQDVEEDEEIAPPPIPLTGDEVRNLAYPNEWPADGVAPLTDGRYSEPTAPDSAIEIVVQFQRGAFGEIDGRAAAAVVLATDPGGSGTFYDLHLVTRDDDGAPRSVASYALGDRIRLQALAVDGETVRADFTGFGPDDAACCPTLNVTHLFQLRDGELELTTAQDVEEDEEIAPPPIPLTGDEVRNLAYPNEWPADGVAPLSDGIYTEPIPDSVARVGVEFRRAAFGQLDGRAAAAVVLATSGGGSGTFYELHVVTRHAGGTPRSVARHLLGDRIGLLGLTFDRDTIRVDFTGFAPGDGACCPTRNVTHVFRLLDGELDLVRAAEAPAVQPVAEGATFMAWFRGHTTSRALLASAGLLENVQVFNPEDETWAVDSRELLPDERPALPIDPGTLVIVVARAPTEIPVPLLAPPAACPRNPGPTNPLDPSMIVYGPGNGERFAGAVAVSGLARVFEANVRLRILDAGGAVLADTFTTADVGGPDFGAFAADIPVDVAQETEACVQIFEESARDGLDVNVVQIGVTLLPALPADFPAALLYAGATVVSDSRSSNDEGETFVTAHLAVDAGTAAILAFYERAFAALDAPGQVFDGYTGPNDTPVVYLALQDVSYAAQAIIREGAAPGGATLVEVTINLSPPG